MLRPVLSSYRHGALYVVENVHDKEWIDRLLRQLDPRLFAELQVNLDREYVWCAVLNLGDRPPLTVHEWRDPSGEPIPYLTEQFVEEVKGSLQRGPEHMGVLKEQAARERDRREAELAAALEDSARDFARSQRRLPVFHRSPGLTSTRRQMRSGPRGPELPAP